jgi:hypothetical protein
VDFTSSCIGFLPLKPVVWPGFGFIVEGSEFERYGKKGLDTSKWDWQIGRRPANDSDEDEGGQISHDQTGKRSRITAGLFV